MSELAGVTDQIMGRLSDVTVLFALALALALLIERLLEVLKSLYDMLDGWNDLYTRWTRKAYKIRDYAEKKLRVFEYVEPEKATPVLLRFNEMLLNNQQGYTGTVPVLSGDLVRALYVKIWSKILGILIGIGLAVILKIDLVSLWKLKEHGPESSPYYFILSGIAIGLGSGPMHKIITNIEQRRAKAQKGGQS